MRQPNMTSHNGPHDVGDTAWNSAQSNTFCVPYPYGQISIVRPRSCDAFSLNHALDTGFETGANGVLIYHSGIVCDGNPVEVMAQAIAQSDANAIISAVIVEKSSACLTSASVRRFVAAFHWSSDSLEWRRESGYLYVAEEINTTVLTAGYASADVLFIPKTVWMSVGRFDEQFNTQIAHVDWMWRAARSAIPCFTLLTTRFSGDSSFFTPGKTSPSVLTIASTLRLARNHNVPFSCTALVMARIGKALNVKQPSTSFWASYGVQIGLLRRVAWYANIKMPHRSWAALRRECSATWQLLRWDQKKWGRKK